MYNVVQRTSWRNLGGMLPPANLNQGAGVEILNLIKTDVENGG